jgi:hypothetical protein
MSRARDLFERLRAEGKPGIDALIVDRVAEELFLDFKRSADDGGQRVLHANDNKNLSKAISGFGNSAGGIIIWGVECAPAPDGADVAARLNPLQDAQAFRSRLESAVSRLTVPPHDGVENLVILDPEGGARGFVVTLVPASARAPLRAEAAALRNYYLRAGSSFEVVPHDALAGLFGRPPRAKLDLQVVSMLTQRPPHQADQRTRLGFGLALANVGSVLADKAYIAIWWGDLADAELHVGGQNAAFPVRQSNFPGAQSVALDGASIVPDAVEHVLDCVVTLPEAPRADLAIRITFGARNAEPQQTWIRASAVDLDQAVQRSRAGPFQSIEAVSLTAGIVN